jgi:hypothetical protein
MYSRLGIGSLALASALFIPGLAVGQKKGKGAEPATPQEYALLAQTREVVGKLASADEGTRTLSFEIEYQYPDYGANKNKNPTKYPQKTQNWQQTSQKFREMQQYNEQMARLMRDQQEIARIQDPRQKAQRMQQLQAQMQRMQAQQMQRMWQQAARDNPNKNLGAFKPNNIKMITVSKGFELDVQEKVIVRRQNLPFEYDDKGNPKEFTKEQIAELRGKDTSLPGYRAKYGDLQQGQTVRVYLSAPKGGAKAADDDGDNVAKPEVRMIVILTEGGGPVLGVEKKKKN